LIDPVIVKHGQPARPAQTPRGEPGLARAHPAQKGGQPRPDAKSHRVPRAWLGCLTRARSEPCVTGLVTR
jgi:hypothetical protein